MDLIRKKILAVGKSYISRIIYRPPLSGWPGLINHLCIFVLTSFLKKDMTQLSCQKSVGLKLELFLKTLASEEISLIRTLKFYTQGHGFYNYPVGQ